MFLRHCGNSRHVRYIVTWALALLQLNIFWVTAFHHHDALILHGQTPSVQVASHFVPAGAEASLVCTACQIVRHGAFRPSIRPEAPRPAASVPFQIAVLRGDLRSSQQVIIFGRAPPLS